MFKQTQYINEKFTTLTHLQLLARCNKNKLNTFKIKRDQERTTLIFNKIHFTIDTTVKMYNKSVMLNSNIFEITSDDITFNVTNTAIEINFLNQSIYIIPNKIPNIIQSNMNTFDMFISLFEKAVVNDLGQIILGGNNTKECGAITFKDRTEFIKSGEIMGLKKEHGGTIYRVVDKDKYTLLRITAMDLSFTFNGWL